MRGRKQKIPTEIANFKTASKKPKQYIVRVTKDDAWYLEVDRAKRRLLIHLCTTPTRSYFLERWALIANEVAQLDTLSDDPIDLVFDYTEAAPVPPTLKILIFTKTVGMAMGYPNAFIWRIVPGDPKTNAFLQQVLEAVPSAWLGSMRASSKHFPTRRAVEEHLDKLRAKESNG
jgi:hypothetical protein